MYSVFKNQEKLKDLRASLIGGLLCNIILTGIRFRSGWYTGGTFTDGVFRYIGRLFTYLFTQFFLLL